MYVFGAEVAREMRSAAARGEVADLVSAKKGYTIGEQGAGWDTIDVIMPMAMTKPTSRALRAFACSILETV